ncbi:MAG TPA: hypothetical protein VGE06_09385 [Flavisolibacter sp.]
MEKLLANVCNTASSQNHGQGFVRVWKQRFHFTGYRGCGGLSSGLSWSSKPFASDAREKKVWAFPFTGNHHRYLILPLSLAMPTKAFFILRPFLSTTGQIRVSAYLTYWPVAGMTGQSSNFSIPALRELKGSLEKQGSFLDFPAARSYPYKEKGRTPPERKTDQLQSFGWFGFCAGLSYLSKTIRYDRICFL